MIVRTDAAGTAATSVAAVPARRRRSVPLGLGTAAAVVAAIAALPVLYLAIRAAGASAESWDLILRGRTLWLTARTIALTAAVTAAATAIGVGFAWLAVRSDLPFRRAWATLYALPLVIPSYVGAFVLLAALGPRGLVRDALAPLGVERLPDISGFPGAFLALVMVTYPYVYLLVAAAMRGMDPALEETARTLGRARREVFRAVTWPLLRPSIAAGALLAALYTLHDFGAVSIMRFPTFTQAIFLQYRAAYDRTPAAILSLMLVALAVLIVVAEQRSRGRARYHRAGTGVAREMPAVRLGRWKPVAVGASVLVVGVGLAVPVGTLAFLLVRGLGAGIPLNLTVAPLLNSALVSGLGALATAVAALPVALLMVRFPGRAAAAVERIAYTGYALPGLVVGLAFVFIAARSATFAYQTLPLVVIAYVVLFLPQVVEPLKAGLLQLDPRMEEAGRTLGRRSRVLRRVVLPLLARPAAAGAALAFLTAMKELPATMLLRPTGFETLATRVWTSASVGLYSRAAVPALLIVLAAAVPLAYLAKRIGVDVEEVRA